MSYLLEVKNISKTFSLKGGWLDFSKKTLKAVCDVSFLIETGKSLGIVGESGSGKTTLARIILRLLNADCGRVIFEGEDIFKLNNRELRRVRKNIQMIFQDPYSSLDPRYTIRQILLEGFYLARDKYKTKTQKEDRMRELLKDVYLKEEMLRRYPHQLSGGERQRVAIARALILNPKLLILDEAVSSLDVLIQQEIIHLLIDLQQRFNLTYLFISHNLKVVKKISQEIAVMYKGRIVEVGSTDTIFSDPQHIYTKELLQAAFEYKAAPSDKEIDISSKAQLREVKEGHFVLA